MPEATSPGGTASSSEDGLTLNEGINDITNLLSGLDDDLISGSDEENGDGSVESDEASDEDQLQLEDEDEVSQEDGTPDPQDQKVSKGGEFVPDTGKVTLADGTILTVAELKRNNLFQQDYSRKTMDLDRARVLTKDKELVESTLSSRYPTTSFGRSWKSTCVRSPPGAGEN
jgi:hypothetical protein